MPSPAMQANVADAVAQTAAHSPTTPALQSAAPTQKTGSTEFALGAHVFTGAGIIAILLAIGFFFRYAFVNNLITEPFRVVLGVFLGTCFMGLGYYLNQKYRSYGLSLIGAGAGIVYISLYAAYGVYHLIDLPIAFTALAICSSITVALAYYYDSLALSIYALLGATLITFILPIESAHVLFLYLGTLSLAAFILVSYRRWEQLVIWIFFATTISAMQWAQGDLALLDRVTSIAYISLLSVSYAVTAFALCLRKQNEASRFGIILLYATPISYMVLVAPLVHGESETIFLAVAAFYFAAASIMRILIKTDAATKLSNAALTFALSFFAIFTATHFWNDAHSSTMIWAAEAVGAVFSGIFLRAFGARIVGIVLACFTVLSMLSFDMPLADGARFLANERTVIMATVTLACGALYVAYKRLSDTGASDTERQIAKFIFCAFFFLIPFLWIGLETWNFSNFPSLFVTIYWTFYAFCAAIFSLFIREPLLRYLAYGAGLIAVLGLVWSANTLPAEWYQPFWNLRLVGAAVSIASVLTFAYLLKKAAGISTNDKAAGGWLIGTAFILVLWYINAEVLQYFNSQIAQRGQQYAAATAVLESTKRVALSSAWLLYSCGVLAYGIAWRSKIARYASIGLFTFVVCKVGLYDTATMNDIYRFTSYMSLGLIFLAVGYVYWKYKDRILNFVQAKNLSATFPSQPMSL